MAQVNITVTTVATNIEWYMLNYPKSNACYWALKDADNKLLKEGDHSIPQNVIDSWGTDDSVIENYLVETKVWED